MELTLETAEKLQKEFLNLVGSEVTYGGNRYILKNVVISGSDDGVYYSVNAIIQGGVNKYDDWRVPLQEVLDQNNIQYSSPKPQQARRWWWPFAKSK